MFRCDSEQDWLDVHDGHDHDLLLMRLSDSVALPRKNDTAASVIADTQVPCRHVSAPLPFPRNLSRSVGHGDAP